jgi:hypothetical protein
VPELTDDQSIQPWRSRRAPQPSAPPPSVFAGRGMFAVERPQDAAGLRIDYMLEAVDAFTWRRQPESPHGYVYQAETPEQYEWALSKSEDVHAIGWETALATNLDPAIFGGTWPQGWTCMPECYWNADGGKRDEGRSIPNMLYEARKLIGPAWGTVPVVPIVGCYDASGENPGVGVRLTVADYLPELEVAMRDPAVVGFAVWRVETLAPDDVEALR